MGNICQSHAERLLPFIKEDMKEVLACTHLTEQNALKLWYWFDAYYPARVAKGWDPLPIGVNNKNGVSVLPEHVERHLSGSCLGEPWEQRKTYTKGQLCSYQEAGGPTRPYRCMAASSSPGVPPPNQPYCAAEIHRARTFLNTAASGVWKLDAWQQTASFEMITNLPPLRFNPFAHRLCVLFCERGDGVLTFEEFVDLASCTSRACPRADKVIRQH